MLNNRYLRKAEHSPSYANRKSHPRIMGVFHLLWDPEACCTVVLPVKFVHPRLANHLVVTSVHV